MTWNRRLALAAASFGLVWGAAVLGALATYPALAARHARPLKLTVAEVNELGRVAQFFMSEREAYPRDWEELREWVLNRGLKVDLPERRRWSLKGDEAPVDYWHVPFEYEMVNGQLSIRSLGEDGLPGGSDLNQDIQWPPLGELQPVYPLAEFYREWLYPDWLWVSLLAAAAAADLTLVPLHRRELRNPIPESGSIVLRCVAITVLAGLAAAVLSGPYLISTHWWAFYE